MVLDKEKMAAAGRNFALALERAGKQQTDIMKLTGASQTTVSNWTTRGVSGYKAHQVAEYLGVDPGVISATIGDSGRPIHTYALAEDVVDEETNAMERPAGYQAARPTEADMRRKVYHRRVSALLSASDQLSAEDLRLVEDLILRLSR